MCIRDRDKIKAINSLSNEKVLVDSITDDMERYELIHKVIDHMIIMHSRSVLLAMSCATTLASSFLFCSIRERIRKTREMCIRDRYRSHHQLLYSLFRRPSAGL